jgi:uncharacterized membrane protein YeaQ/YmgE (transglycosylase-associated protein family)
MFRYPIPGKADFHHLRKFFRESVSGCAARIPGPHLSPFSASQTAWRPITDKGELHFQEPAMPTQPEFQQIFQQWANDILVWIGFGTLVGLLAKAVMPGRDPGGAMATLLMGIGGTAIGCGLVSYFYQGERVTPISPLGLAVATGGAFVILFFYRLLAGRLFLEEARTKRVVRAPHRSRQVEVVHYED